MSTPLTDKAHAKINLTLRVLGRRADGYHELESLVAFADLADTLSLQPGEETTLEVTGPFAAACGPIADNLAIKAAAALRRRVEGLRAGRFVLEKNIPVAGGVGGGSADAAAVLRLLARLNGLSSDAPCLAQAALAVGADVPVCIDARPRIMRGVGELLSLPLDLAPLAAVLANPRVPLATRDVFTAFSGPPAGFAPLGEVPSGPEALIDFLDRHGNDLTEAAVACAPVIGEVLVALRRLPGVRLARMSGSGPTCFALFASAQAAVAAAVRLQAGHKDWWVHCGSIGAMQTCS